MLRTTSWSEMGSKGGEDSQWGWERHGLSCYSNFLTNTNSMYQLSPFFGAFFFFAYQIYCLLGPHPTYCLWWSIIASRCLNNKSHITCVCKMVINNATVPRDHRWILTYHLRQFPENVALLLPMGSRSVQVFYNLCRKKIETVCQCPESEG